MEGTIVKGIAGFYYVKNNAQVYQCKARGLFKKQGVTPAVGDQVYFEPGSGEDDNGLILEIRERKNHFIRPPVANVDCFAIVMAAAEPAPSLAVADKFLVMAERSRTDIVFCINKTDLASGQTVEKMKAIYSPIYPLVCLSGATGQGIAELKHLIEGKHAALAGPSGVGKSTLLNCLIPEADAETGCISRKSKRGKHTTRHCELFDLGCNTMLFDTPGFSSFDVLEAGEEELQYLYPEMEPFIGGCKYHDCRHLKEPGCAVRNAVEMGFVAPERYASYRGQLQEIRDSNKY